MRLAGSSDVQANDGQRPAGSRARELGWRRGHQTQWAAQFAVASELCKRGYEVALTMGNRTPDADLMVMSPIDRKMFLVDTKGLHRRNPWLVSLKPALPDFYYVFAFVPTGEPSQFFVLTQADVNAMIKRELRRLGRPLTYPVKGITWNLTYPYKDRWNALPA